jgi:hypothetical protein
MVEWSHDHVWQSAIYFCAFLGMARLLRVRAPKKWHIALLTIFYALTVIAITRPMSGHDETAHMTSWYRALEAENIVERPPEIEFNRHVHELLIQERFLGLHHVPPGPADLCPHMLLGGCGDSPSPARLYGSYISVYKYILGSQMVPTNPIVIEFTIRALHLLFLVLLLGLAYIVLESLDGYLVYCATILTCGTFWGQFASLTNDVPMYVSGLLGLLAIWSSVASEKNRHCYLAVAVYLGSIWITWDVDISHILNPLVFGLVAISSSARIFCRPQNLVQTRKITAILGALFTFFLAALGFLFISKLHLILGNSWVAQNFSTLISKLPRLDKLLGGLDLVFMEYLQIAKTYLNSVGGSFVWGHTYYPLPFEFAYGTCWLWGAVTIAALFYRNDTTRPRTQVAIFSGAVFLFLGMMFGLIVRIAAWRLHAPEADAFIKPRLTAPGIAIILVPVLFFFNYIAGRTRMLTLYRVVVGVCLWQAYYAIKIYLCDAV